MCRSLRGRREDGPGSDKRDRFKLRVGNQREHRIPEATGSELVMNRFRGLVGRIAGTVSISRQAQRVFAEYGGKIAGSVDLAGRLQRWCRDLQQQSERSKQPTETAAESLSLSAQRTGDDQPPKATNSTRQSREPAVPVQLNVA
jgi:hypothetical protein